MSCVQLDLLQVIYFTQDHRTPLMVACVEKQHGFVKALIERGANISAKDSVS